MPCAGLLKDVSRAVENVDGVVRVRRIERVSEHGGVGDQARILFACLPDEVGEPVILFPCVDWLIRVGFTGGDHAMVEVAENNDRGLRVLSEGFDVPGGNMIVHIYGDAGWERFFAEQRGARHSKNQLIVRL